ncbi:MAG: hypothetical protein Greene041614_912 [Parcubacteria group bacterium Greene0416_14]|nr:MAG: hypothetical protein Greene041614_912 [Parcubacteria group bacterium Greene0416_14]TSD00891.1 MAG: hypothetical protein Greene101415_605 [Parcubacteria group bacterium Greene1014_15]TSD07972.1 MAG: hypothetical protein Greene07144_513 [Parcubacteria group bacterium Greene0714_4]
MFDALLFWTFILGTSAALIGRHLLTKSIQKNQRSIQSKKNTPWRWWCERVVQFIGFVFIAYALAGYAVPGTFSDYNPFKILGVILFVWSVGIHLCGKYDLGANWTNAKDGPTVREGPITKHGLYRYSRNPMYAGTLGMVLGLELMTQNFFVLALWLIVFLYIRNVVASEEKLLRKEKGQEYIEYCKRVPRFFGFF